MGDTGAGWSFLADHLGLKHVDCVFPTAQTLPVTLNGGMSMPSWFDIKGLNYSAEVMDHGQVAESVAYLHELIEAQKAKGIAADRIVVGGFSQGGNIALKAFMSSKEKLGGCVALSTWLEPGSAYEKEVLQNKGAPIMWGHGVADPMVPAVLGTNSVLHLRKLGYTLDHKEYPGMGHSSCPAELEDIRAFLAKTLPATPPKPLTAEEIDAMPVKELRRKLQAANVAVSDRHA